MAIVADQAMAAQMSFARCGAWPATWQRLSDEARALASLLRAPARGAAGLCAICHGPAGRSPRCYSCDLHSQCAPGLCADAVIPIAFAVKGGPHARDLWQYKSLRHSPDVAGRAARRLRALLLVFLHDHGRCVWRAAGMPGPTHLAVVPTCRGRPGAHPLRGLIAPLVRGPWAELVPRPGRQPVRDLDPARFAAAPVPGARVLLLDDTWTTGCTAQSAAIALRMAGARSVAIVVLGRHVDAGAVIDLPAMPFRPESCPVHENGARMG